MESSGMTESKEPISQQCIAFSDDLTALYDYIKNTFASKTVDQENLAATQKEAITYYEEGFFLLKIAKVFPNVNPEKWTLWIKAINQFNQAAKAGHVSAKSKLNKVVRHLKEGVNNGSYTSVFFLAEVAFVPGIEGIKVGKVAECLHNTLPRLQKLDNKELYQYGKGILTHLVALIEKEAIEKNRPVIKCYLAKMYLMGIGVKKDFKKAHKLLQEVAMLLQKLELQFIVSSNMILQKLIEEDKSDFKLNGLEKWLRQWQCNYDCVKNNLISLRMDAEKASYENDISAVVFLSEMYYLGAGCQKDHSISNKLLQKAMMLMFLQENKTTDNDKQRCPKSARLNTKYVSKQQVADGVQRKSSPSNVSITNPVTPLTSQSLQLPALLDGDVSLEHDAYDEKQAEEDIDNLTNYMSD